MPARDPLPSKRLTLADAASLGPEGVTRHKKEVRKIRNQRYAQGSGSKLLLQKKWKILSRLVHHWRRQRRWHAMYRFYRYHAEVSPPSEVLPPTKIETTPTPIPGCIDRSLFTKRVFSKPISV